MSGSAFIYCRISSKTDSNTLNNQKFICESYCRKHNIPIKSIMQETKSSRNMLNLSSLSKFVSKMSKGDILIFSDITRFSRNVKQALLFLDNNKHINVYSVNDNISFSNHFDKFQFIQQLNLSEYESNKCSFRRLTQLNIKNQMLKSVRSKHKKGKKCK